MKHRRPYLPPATDTIRLEHEENILQMSGSLGEPVNPIDDEWGDIL